MAEWDDAVDSRGAARLRDAKAVLKRQTDKVYLLRQNRELYEGAAVPPPARPATAAAGSTTASRGGAGSGGPMKQKKLSQEDQAAMVKRLESYAVRKRENEARARAELDKASVEVARRRLSQDEQMGMVKRLEEHAKIQCAEEGAGRKRDLEAFEEDCAPVIDEAMLELPVGAVEEPVLEASRVRIAASTFAPGKGLFATVSAEVGEVVLEEAPFLLVPYNGRMGAGVELEHDAQRSKWSKGIPALA